VQLSVIFQSLKADVSISASHREFDTLCNILLSLGLHYGNYTAWLDSRNRLIFGIIMMFLRFMDSLHDLLHICKTLMDESLRTPLMILLWTTLFSLCVRISYLAVRSIAKDILRQLSLVENLNLNSRSLSIECTFLHMSWQSQIVCHSQILWNRTSHLQVLSENKTSSTRQYLG